MTHNLLHYRRQFLLTSGLVHELEKWQHRKISDVHLYVHPDLEITEIEGPSSVGLLLGYIFDPAHPTKSNEEIVSDIISRIRNLKDLFAALKPYTGRYAFMYRDATSLAILHDPFGVREIYYCTQPNRVICGSQPNLIEAFSEPRLGVTEDQAIQDFYKNDMKLVRNGRSWVGDETYFQNVKHLMPNHYLDIRSLTTKRYWPNRRLERMNLRSAVKQSCDFLKGTLEAVTSRYDVMMAVTAGHDSRSLLAASKELSDQIYYFINKHSPLSDKSRDIRIPRKMFNKLNIPFHVHDVDGPVDEEFKKIFLNNTFLSTDLLLPTIYNVYYKRHQDKMNLLGLGEMGRGFFPEAPCDLDGYWLAHSLKHYRSRYATAQCEKWLQEARGVAEKYNVDIMALLLLDELLGNFACVGNSESDIAIEEFDPYSSHYIIEIMLSFDRRQGDLFEAMFREMWPELLDFPFNPPDTLEERVADWLRKIGIYKHLKRGKYRLDRWRFRRFVGASQ